MGAYDCVGFLKMLSFRSSDFRSLSDLNYSIFIWATDYLISYGVPSLVSKTSKHTNSEPIGDSESRIHIFYYFPNLESKIDNFYRVTQREGSPIQSVWYNLWIYELRPANSQNLFLTSSTVALGSNIY